MSGLANYLINTISSAIFGVKGEEESMATSFYDSDRYSPSTTEVLAVKDALFQRFKLPLELIDRIIDFAEYWPRTTTCRTGGQLHVRSGRPDFEDQFLVRSWEMRGVRQNADSYSCAHILWATYPRKPLRQSRKRT